MGSMLYDKIYGCLLGGLIGDAMGASVEGWHYQRIIETLGEVSEFSGEGTDDSLVKSLLCKAIIDNDGYISADEFAASFMENISWENGYNLLFIPVKNMYHKLQDSICLPMDAGYGNMQSSSSAMAISPMGIINACNPRQAALETWDVAGLIHSGTTSFCRDAACAIAAAVAEAFNPYATVQSVLDASTSYLHKKSSVVMRDEIYETLNMARQSGSYVDFRTTFYDSGKLRSVMCDPRETVPVALAIFFLAEGDPVKSILYGVNFGRDADTIATMVGSLAGAFMGIGALRREWVKKIETSCSEHARLALRMEQITQRKAKQAMECIDRMRGLC